MSKNLYTFIYFYQFCPNIKASLSTAICVLFESQWPNIEAYLAFNCFAITFVVMGLNPPHDNTYIMH